MTVLVEESTTSPVQAIGYKLCGGFLPAFKNYRQFVPNLNLRKTTRSAKNKSPLQSNPATGS
ncbi:MAG: hypothetical protein RLZZ141_1494 [Pseudomonadota bacterium]|jgi:hypothetical protein